jgi:hypothetical protein
VRGAQRHARRTDGVGFGRARERERDIGGCESLRFIAVASDTHHFGRARVKSMGAPSMIIEKWKTPFAVKDTQHGTKIGRVGVAANTPFRVFLRDCARIFSADKGEVIEPSRISVQFVFFQNTAEGQRRRSTLSVDEGVDFGKILKQNGGDSFFCVGFRLSKKDRKMMKRGGGGGSVANVSKNAAHSAALNSDHAKRSSKDELNAKQQNHEQHSAALNSDHAKRSNKDAMNAKQQNHEQHSAALNSDQAKRSSKDATNAPTTYAQASVPKPVVDSVGLPTSTPTRSHATSPARGSKASGGTRSTASSPLKAHSAKHVTPKSPKSPLRASENHRHPRSHKPMDDVEHFFSQKIRDPVVFPGFRRSFFGAIGTEVDDSAKKRSVPLTRDASMLMK